MRRVAVLGASGNGKSTFARALAQRLEVPYVELDALHHLPGWTEDPPEVFYAKVEEALQSDGWVADGNYERKLGDLVVERADTVVWLDQPLPMILWRLWLRTIARIRDQQELWNENRQTWRAAFWGRESLFAWTIRSHFRLRRHNPRRLARYELVRLRSPRAVREFLRTADGRLRPRS